MSWQTIYQNYDEEALIVFANAGLLRRARKDVANGNVSLTNPANGAFDSDGQQVILHPQGIQQAECNCSAAGCCKHILAAVLWVLENQSVSSAESTSEELPTAASVEPVLPALLALEPERLMKLTGKANCRLAVKLLQQWDEEKLQVRLEEYPTQLKLFIPHFEEPIIFLAASGFEGMLSSLADNQRKAVHLAAIVNLWSQQQQSWPWPEDIATEPSGERPLSLEDNALIETIELFIQDLLQQGLSHISKSSAAQLHLLNMSARSEGLPRLAAYLRNLSGQVKLLADRHFTLDEGQVLQYLSQLSIYLYQLTHADTEQLLKLRGQQRKQYDEKSSSLSLIPICADWWTVNSGALGATFTFWDSENQQLLQCTQARANRLDTSFNRQNIWSTQAIWKQTADKLMRRPFSLRSPRLSDEGKLSASGDSYAESQNSFLSFEQYNALKNSLGVQQWQDLTANFAQDKALISPPILLHIKAYQPLIWDEIEQCVIWEVNDQQDNSAYLRLNWGSTEQNGIEELRFITQSQQEIVAVCVQPIYREQQIDFIPLTLWLKKADNIEYFHLDFDSFPRKKKRSTFISHIQAFMEKKTQQKALPVAQLTLAQQLSRPILNILETQACTGRRTLTSTQKEQLEACRQTAADLGITLLEQSLTRYLSSNNSDYLSLLKLTWLCHRLQQLQNQLPLQIK
nr:SWIM zinc finger family protein [uncultured Moellerella sp.]